MATNNVNFWLKYFVTSLKDIRTSLETQEYNQQQIIEDLTRLREDVNDIVEVMLEEEQKESDSEVETS